MPCWYYDKKELRNTPSASDGIDYETESRYRKEGARFIIDIGTKMDLGYNTMATGVVYFHRFYMFHSFRQFPRYVTACCCLFLAGKVEETPKKCKDIIKAARVLLTDQKFAQFGEDPKEEVMTLERILLQTIKFDLQVEHPYSYLLRYAKCLKGDKQKLQKMVQMAWTFVNDSLCTTLSLQWEPEIIAVALMYLAGKLSQFEVVDWSGRTGKHLRWWDMFVEDVTMDLLENICHQVLDLYSSNTGAPAPDSPPLPPRPGAPSSSATSTPIKANQTQNGQDVSLMDGEISQIPVVTAVTASTSTISAPPNTAPIPEMPVYPPFPQAYSAPPFPPSSYPPAVPPVGAHLPAPPPGPPPPHIAAPQIPAPPSAVYPPYIAAPPTHFQPVVPATYYQPPGVQPTHRPPFYPPST